ncbi:DHHC palmitoyltransferase-domain-containing protein [Mortierella sp. GBAus27b]|nr:DHHC palmitoyltransferase-domain-containing protein [Mortierella sp. GBAus27b]
MSASIPFQALPTSDPADHEISTRPRRRLTLEDRLERLIDRVSGGLGPILIVLALGLLSLAFYCFFAVFIPFHYPPPPEGQEQTISNVGYVANMVWACYLVWGIMANYYFAVTTPPGAVIDGLSQNEGDLYQGVLGQIDIFTETPPTCKRCHLPKPERTHHCSVCKKCILKYDHHCPWIHNCVGHFNHRYFVMFLTYLPIACFYFVYMGIGPLQLLAESVLDDNWPYSLPKPFTAFSIVLAGAMGLAVGGMGCWHWYLTLTAQTTLEQHHNSHIRAECKKKGDTFTNMYDFGVIGNLQDFFNTGRRGHYPWYTAFLPIRIPPIGNGKRFQKSGRGFILTFADDDDDDMV